MVMLDDSKFTDRNRLLVKTVIAYAKDEIPFRYVRHVLDWGTLPPNERDNGKSSS